MNRFNYKVVGVVLVVIMVMWSSIGSTPHSQSHNQHKHMKLIEMLSDSVMMDLMMDHIASDNQHLKLMTDKMIYYAVGDTPKMTVICAALLNDKTMRMMLKNMENDTIKVNKNMNQESKER